MKPCSAALPVWGDPHLIVEDEPTQPGRPGRPIDLVHLTRQTFGDKRLEDELLRLFMQQSTQIMTTLDGPVSERAGVSVLELVHMLSGSARAVGANEVAALVGRLEIGLRQSGLTDIDPFERRTLGALVERTNSYIMAIIGQE